MSLRNNPWITIISSLSHNTDDEMENTKITAKIYQPLWSGFQEQAKELFLNRDAFLSHMIRCETPELKKDLAGRKLSSKAKRYISNQLNLVGHDKKQGLVPVSISIRKEIANALNEVVENSNLVRDAFINRLLVFLRSNDTILNHFGIPQYTNQVRGAQPMPTSPLKAMEEIRNDPFYYIRGHVSETRGEGLYTLRFPQNLIGFSCYLCEEEVPGTKEFKKGEKIAKVLLSEPDAIEEGFATHRSIRKGGKS
jgi:hypothetical protein